MGHFYFSIHNRAIALFLRDTGVRARELCGLEMHDLDLVQRRALIRNGKGEKDHLLLSACAPRMLWLRGWQYAARQIVTASSSTGKTLHLDAAAAMRPSRPVLNRHPPSGHRRQTQLCLW